MSSMYGICQGIKTSQDRDFILSAAGCLVLFILSAAGRLVLFILSAAGRLVLFISPFSNCTVFILDL